MENLPSGKCFTSRVWRTLDKDVLLHREMTDSHLLNCVKHQIRFAWKGRAECIQKLQRLKRRAAEHHSARLRDSAYVSRLLANAFKATWRDFVGFAFDAMLIELQSRKIDFTIHDCHAYFARHIEHLSKGELDEIKEREHSEED